MLFQREKQPSIEVVRLMMVKESSVQYNGQRVRSQQDAQKIFRAFLDGADREYMVMMGLDTKFAPVCLHTVCIGTLNSCLMHPREIFKAAMLANADSIMLCHNHPSGDPTPSTEDRRVTMLIKEIGDLLQMPLLDHIILGDEGSYVSLKERGVI